MTFVGVTAATKVEGGPAQLLKQDLLLLARDFRQDSIAWAEATTTFIESVESPRPPVC